MTVVKNTIHAGLQERISGGTEAVRLSTRAVGTERISEAAHGEPEIQVEPIQPWRRMAQHFSMKTTSTPTNQSACPPENYIG